MRLKLSTSGFLTFFLTAYLWIGLLFYKVVGIELADEALIALLLFFTLYMKSRRRNTHVSKEIFIFICVVIFYLLYSLALGIADKRAILFDCIQEIKPYVTFYCGYVLFPEFGQRQRRIIIRNCIAVALIAVAALPSSLSRYQYFMGDHITLLASLSMTLFVCCSYFGETKGIIRWLMLTLGLFSTRSKFYVEYIFTVYVWRLKKKLNLSNASNIVGLMIVAGLAIFVIWKKFSFYVIYGFNNGSGVARSMLYITAIMILMEYFPFGCGLGSFANHASRVWYSPLYDKYGLSHLQGMTREDPSFIADTFYPVTAQFGVAGIAVIAAFWIKRYRELKSLCDPMMYKTGLSIIIFMATECFADTTLIGNRGGILMLLLGIICGRSKKYNINKSRINED